MKKTYEMRIDPNVDNLNINNNNIQNTEMYNKIIEDPFLPAEVESYLSVKNNFKNIILNYL